MDPASLRSDRHARRWWLEPVGVIRTAVDHIGVPGRLREISGDRTAHGGCAVRFADAAPRFRCNIPGTQTSGISRRYHHETPPPPPPRACLSTSSRLGCYGDGGAIFTRRTDLYLPLPRVLKSPRGATARAPTSTTHVLHRMNAHASTRFRPAVDLQQSRLSDFPDDSPSDRERAAGGGAASAYLKSGGGAADFFAGLNSRVGACIRAPAGGCEGATPWRRATKSSDCRSLVRRCLPMRAAAQQSAYTRTITSAAREWSCSTVWTGCGDVLSCRLHPLSR